MVDRSLIDLFILNEKEESKLQNKRKKKKGDLNNWISFYCLSINKFHQYEYLNLNTKGINEKFIVVEIFQPFILNASTILKTSLPINKGKIKLEANKTMGLLIDLLIRELYYKTIKTITLQYNVEKINGNIVGENENEKFNSFIKKFKDINYQQSFFFEYPILAKIISEACLNWVNRYRLLFKYLANDYKEISKHFNISIDEDLVITSIIESGDRHENGECVLIIEINSFYKILFKPKNLSHQIHFMEFIYFLNEKFQAPFFSKLKIINKGNYGWVEYINYQSCNNLDEIKKYYFNLGFLQALLYFLNGYDVHFENIIACGEIPYIIDIECLFNPRIPINEIDSMTDSVLHCTLLPKTVKVGDKAFRLGASENIEDQEGLLKASKLVIDKTGVKIKNEYGKYQSLKNLPFIGNQKYPIYNFSSEFKEGFTLCAKTFIENKKEVLSFISSTFSNDILRVIFRNTFHYSHLLDSSYHPNYLRSIVERKVLFSHLESLTLKKDCFSVSNYELDILLRDNIPSFYFRSSSKELLSVHGKVLKSDFFASTGIDIVKQKIVNSNWESIQMQLWLMDINFKLNINNNNLSFKKNHDSALDQALELEKVVSEFYFHKKEKELYITSNETSGLIENSGINLYNGILGIAFMYIYLYKVSRISEFKLKAIRIIKQIHKNSKAESDSIGLFTGLSGFIYVLSHAYFVFREKHLLEIAKSYLINLQKGIESTEEFDIINGISGCVFAIKALRSVDYDSQYDDTLELLGNKLIRLAKEDSGNPSWFSRNLKKNLGGVSHGAAGVAMALGEIFRITKKKVYLKYMIKAIKYQDTLFVKSKGNWKDIRFSESEFQYSWCNGSVGICISKISLKDLIPTVSFRQIYSAFKGILENGLGQNHSICHGDMGVLELFLLAKSENQMLRYGLQSEAAYNQIIEDIKSNGIKIGSNQRIDLGLMTGISGVIFQILRMNYSNNVPSLLLFDNPN